MQEIYNSGWYGAQEINSWPLKQVPESTQGEKLPDSILADLKLLSRSSDLYLSGIQAAEQFISVVFSSSTGVAAALTVEQPVKLHWNYPLTVFQDGIAGTIVFGHGAHIEKGSWHFTSEQGALLPGCFIHPPAWSVTSVGKEGQAGLTGCVSLTAGSDLQIRPIEVQLGYTRNEGAAAFPNRKSGKGFLIELSAEATNRSTSSSLETMLKTYSGPCSMRLENDDCPYITSINGVTPDTNGNITIRTEVNDTVLSATMVRDEGTYTQAETYLCKPTPYSSVVLMLGSSEYMSASDSLTLQNSEFRRCGNDLCETSGGTGGSGTGGTQEYDGAYVNPFQNISLLSVPDNDGCVYNGSTRLLEPIAGNSGKVYGVLRTKGSTQATAVFRYFYYNGLTEPSCGILYCLRNAQGAHPSFRKFQCKGSILSMGKSSMDIQTAYGSQLEMKVTFAEGVFTGTLKRWDPVTKTYTLLGTLTDTAASAGQMGLFFENCKCKSWEES